MTPLGQLVAATDFLRRPAAPLPGLAAHKEWHHFLVETPELLLLVNLSLSEEPDPTTGRERTTGRLKVLVRDRGGGWDGDVEVYDASSLRAQSGRVDVDFGPHAIRFDGERYTIALALAERPITVELTLRPTAAPLLIRHVRLAPGKPLSWVMVPRLVATGTVTHRGRVHRLDEAPAYHDHNWGYFGWGDDFTWEWGTALPSVSSRWSVALVRTTDRARTRTLLQALYLWRGARLVRLFRGDELTLAHEGAARPAAILKVPRVMALVEPGLAADVPARVRLEARAPGAELALTIDSVDLAQILMPDEEARASVTTLNQVYGRLTLRGRVDGEEVALEAPGVFEYIRATTAPEPPRPRAIVRPRVDAPADDGGGPLLAIIADGFRALAAERPDELARLCALLDGRRLALTVDGEAISVAFAAATVSLARASDAAPSVALTLSRRLIADVIRAETTLAGALLDGRLVAVGALDELERLHDALLVYVHGATRAPTFPSLWRRFRALDPEPPTCA